MSGINEAVDHLKAPTKEDDLKRATDTSGTNIPTIQAESEHAAYIDSLSKNEFSGIPFVVISRPTHTATGRKISDKLTEAQAHCALWYSNNTQLHAPKKAGIVEAQQLSFKLEKAFTAGYELNAAQVQYWITEATRLGQLQMQQIDEFNKRIAQARAEAAKQAIYALFEVGNCPQLENGAGDGYIECGDALKFAGEYAEQILKGEVPA